MTVKDQASLPSLRAETARLANDSDVLMCYQIFLGRNPETSFVIQEAKSHPLERVIAGFLQSQEFISEVYQKLGDERPLPHEAALFSPSRKQLGWLCECFSFTEQQSDSILLSEGWKDVFRILTQPPGDPAVTRGDGERQADADDASQERHPDRSASTTIMRDLISSKLSAIEHDVSAIRTALSKLIDMAEANKR